MKLLEKREPNVSVKKASIYAIVINGLQIALMLAIILATLIRPGNQVNELMVETLSLIHI